MYRLLHVCTDPKHLAALDRFAGPEFDNRVILAPSRGQMPGMKADWSGRGYAVELAGQSRHTLSWIARAAREYDMVVMHDMDGLKSMAVHGIGEGIPIGWLFFGYELYSRRPEGLCTVRTLEVGHQTAGPTLFARGLNRVKHIARWHTARMPGFEDALTRTDLMFGIIPEEYQELQKRWSDLPAFFRFPVRPNYGVYDPGTETERSIILVGNSRSRYNNHLDVLDDIIRFGLVGPWRFVVPFSYGPDGPYAAAVREATRGRAAIQLVENFLPTDEYLGLFRQAAAAVYNSYRQLALWNVLAALSHGVKVYLPAQNPTFPWLRRYGAVVHDTATFGADLQAGALTLPPQQVLANRSAIRRISEDYPYAEFQRRLARWLEERR